MSRKLSINEKIANFAEEKILQDNIENLFGERFGRYSKYIIQDRALPDCRDGLKPVQRRILYAMYKLGMFPKTPYKKSARIVGEVIGKYHPHGDISVYEAMVRMSQSFKMLLPLVDMHGNNGSIDGDGAAAMRYTEARLSVYADYLLKDLNKHTVNFVPNFDDEELEPVVLPSRFPNLLVNGATGIAAGYATEMPPHNVGEIINAIIYRINKPDCSLSEIMKIVQGPDFPTGGIVQGIDEIKKAFKTGRGKIVVKSRSEIVEAKNINQIIVTEIPYGVNKAQLVKKMTDVVSEKAVDGVIDIRDESDREGLRIVIDLKKDANAEDIRNFFLRTTDLQINYSYNNVCIYNKRPVLMGLLELLDSYIEHQKEIITNRSNYDLNIAKKRLHIVEGLITMVSILDAVIQTIRSSANKKDAKENIMANYHFTEEQAEAIVMLQLYRLTNTDIVALTEEKDDLNNKITELNEILSNEKALLRVIKSELLDTLKEIDIPRKTTIEHKIDESIKQVDVKVLIAKEDAVIIITKDGYIKRMSPKVYASDEENKLKEEDFILAKYDVTTLDTLLFFTDKGSYVYLPVQNIPETRPKELGRNIAVMATIPSDEKIIFSVPISDFEADRYVLFTTKHGLTKRTHIRELVATRYSKALKATKLRDGDEVVSVDICNGEDHEVMVVTKEGYMLRYNASEISLFAPPSFGVKAIELKNRPDDLVLGAFYVNPKDVLLVLSEKGGIRKFKCTDVPKGKKIHVGKLCVNVGKPNGYLIDFEIIHEKNETSKCYLVGDVATKEINLEEDVKGLNVKKLPLLTTKVGNPICLIATRSSIDFE